MVRILLIRHGHVEGIKPQRFRGREELPLTAKGQQEAQITAARIATGWRASALYSSPMGRAIETAKYIGQAVGLREQVLPQLNDLDYGAWQWKTFEEISATSQTLFTQWFNQPHLVRFPNGESLQDLAARAADAIQLIASRNPGETVVIVGHGTINRALILEILGLPLSAFWHFLQSPCGITEIVIKIKPPS